MDRHIFFIDPLEKLNFKKDTSLLMAHTFKQNGFESYLLFDDEFTINNKGEMDLKVHDFSGTLENGSFYLKNFEVLETKKIKITSDMVIHMRLDPPFDQRYLKSLWKLRFLEARGIRVVNSARGILLHHEKMTAYLNEKSLPSLVTSSAKDFTDFCNSHKLSAVILKPMELFQGIGVEKITINQNQPMLASFLESKFETYISQFGAPVIVQPFDKNVEKGEIRTIFFQGEELGTILKVPKKGDFLANIARGACYQDFHLSGDTHELCGNISHKLWQEDGISLIAFDIINDLISEVNVTCPGLLVEVSNAKKENLCQKIAEANFSYL